MKQDELKKLSKQLDSGAKMPYCWEDVYNRLVAGLPLPFKVEVQDERIKHS